MPRDDGHRVIARVEVGATYRVVQRVPTLCCEWGLTEGEKFVDEQGEYYFTRKVTIPYLGGECLMFYSPLAWERVDEHGS